MRSRSKSCANRRGATIVLVAVSMPFALAVGALAVDMGMLFKVRVEAQRTADAAALAGASAFMDPDVNTAAAEAERRAFEYVDSNQVGSTRFDLADTNQIKVEVTRATQSVRVVVRRPATETFFGPVLGIGTAGVAAAATAAALDAGAAYCVMPFAIPDRWEDVDQDVAAPTPDNDIEDEGESWTYDAAQGDTYVPFSPDPSGASGPTGYGAGGGANPRDVGREIVLRPQDPTYFGPGNVRIWGDDADRGDVDERLEDCDPNKIELGQPVDVVGPPPSDLGSSIRNIIRDNPGNQWDNSTNRPQGDWRNSPRVVRIPLYDPSLYNPLLLTPDARLSFNGFALLFLEGVSDAGTPEERIRGRLMFYTDGTTAETTSPLVKTVRLVR